MAGEGEFPVMPYIPVKVEVYDSTLRDGAQGEGISFSLEDKLLIAQKLDEAGFHYIEGGWPNPTSPKDMEFYRRVKTCGLQNTRVTAFGSTCRASNRPDNDPILRTLLEADTEIITIFIFHHSGYNIKLTRFPAFSCDCNGIVNCIGIYFLGLRWEWEVSQKRQFSPQKNPPWASWQSFPKTSLK